MLGPLGYALWLVGLLAELYVVVSAFVRKDFLRYCSLNMYMLAAALVTAGGYAVIGRYGLSSVEYSYFYYYTDSLLTILMYFSIIQLYRMAFCELRLSRYIRGGAILLLAATAGFSYLVIQKNADRLTSQFVFELGQNLYFVGVVLTYLLWLTVLKLRETRARIIQLVLSVGIYFSGAAAIYALRNLFPGFALLKVVIPVFGLWLPAAWAYTFTRIPEEARLATAQVAAPHQ